MKFPGQIGKIKTKEFLDKKKEDRKERKRMQVKKKKVDWKTTFGSSFQRT